MKKTIALLLALVLCFGMCACGENGNGENPIDTEPQTSGDTTTDILNSNIYWEPFCLFTNSNIFDCGYFTGTINTRQDGTLTEGYGATGTWSLEDAIVTIRYDGGSGPVQYKLKTVGDIHYLIGKVFVYSSVPVDEVPRETIELTLDNWADYFEIRTVTHEKVRYDQFGDVISSELKSETILMLKEEYAVRCLMDESEFLFRYDSNIDAGAVKGYASQQTYPMFGTIIRWEGTNVEEFPMVKVQGTLVLADWD